MNTTAEITEQTAQAEERPPVAYEAQAMALAKLFVTPITAHQNPMEAGIVPKLQAILTSSPELLLGLFNGTLFGEEGVTPEKQARLEKVDSLIEKVKKQLEELREEQKSLKAGENPYQGAVKTFLKAGANAFLTPSNLLPSSLPYRTIGFPVEHIPEPPVKKGRKQGSKFPKQEGEKQENDPNQEI